MVKLWMFNWPSLLYAPNSLPYPFEQIKVETSLFVEYIYLNIGLLFVNDGLLI